MKKITAIINPAKLDDVRNQLTEMGLKGMTLSEVKGFGRQRGHTELYRGAEYNIEFIPKIQLEIALPAERVDEAVDSIVKAARTGKIGDGKVIVTDLEQAIRIRTQEMGNEAL